MQFITKRIQLKESLKLLDLIYIYKLSELQSKAKKNSEKRLYAKELIKVLTYCKNPRFYEVQHLQKIFELHGLLKKEANENNKDPLQSIKNVVYYLASRLSKTPLEIETGTELKDIENLVSGLRKIEIENSLNMVRSYHDPAKFAKELINKYKTVDNALRHFKEETKDDKVKSIDAFRILKMAASAQHHKVLVGK